MKTSKSTGWRLVRVLGPALAGAMLASACGSNGHSTDQAQDAAADARLLAEGQKIFRYDTFGDETHWTDTLRMHEVISSAVDPTTGA